MALDLSFGRRSATGVQLVDGMLVVRILFYLSIIHFLGLLIATLNTPLLDQHAFRQTNTALSVFYMMRGRGWLVYETPILGAPWTVPLEFPIYQWLVALLSTWSSLPIDSAGRLIASAFTLASLGPAAVIMKSLALDRRLFYTFGALYLFAPIYMFWGRSFMIESTAVFFAILWLASLIKFILNRSFLWFVVALVSGSAAALTKITTFPAFVFAGAAFTVHHAFFQRDRSLIKPYLLAGSTVLLPVMLTLAWVHFTDMHKDGNALVQQLQSAQRHEWNYGTIMQRMGTGLWWNTIAKRSLSQASGLGWLIAGGIAAYFGPRNRYCYIAGVAVSAYLLPFFLFAPLHSIHNYYQTANAMFLIAAVAIICAELLRQNRTKIALGMIVTTIITQLAVFYLPRGGYGHSIGHDRSSVETLRIAQIIRQRTSENGAIIVFGLSWSGEIHYYSERRGIALPQETSPEDMEGDASLIRDITLNMDKWMGGAPLEAIVDCNPRKEWRRAQRAAIDELISRYADRSIKVNAECEIYLVDPP